MKRKTIQRESGVELLKIIAIFLIAISHFLPKYGDASLPSYIDLTCATVDTQGLLLALFNYFGQLGNCIFLVCSSYFLVDQSATRLEKILSMILDCLLFAMLSLAIHSALGFQVGIARIIKSFLPVTFGNNWYIGCYLLLYTMHSGLNMIIKQLDKKTHLLVACILIALYCIISFLYSAYYYNALIGFVVVYFIVAYMKLYLKKCSDDLRLNQMILLASILCLLGMIVFTGLIGLKIELLSFQMMRWNQFRNPFIILISLSLLNLFKRKKFISPAVNYISSESLLIYIITEDMLFRQMVRPVIWLRIYQIYSYRYVALWVLALAVGGFVAGAVIATLYKETLQIFVARAAQRLSMTIERKVDALLNKLIQAE